MAKCKSGKGCGNSCISVPYACQLEINQSDSGKLDKVADLLLSRDQVLKTPEQAASYLERNADNIAGVVSSTGLNSGDVVVLGIEPYRGKESFFKDGDPDKETKSFIGDLQDKTPGLTNAEFYNRNPVAAANYIKTSTELGQLYGSDASTSKIRSELAEVKINEKYAAKIKENLKRGADYADKGAPDPYHRNMGKMFDGTKLKTITNINASSIPLPDASAWPFKNLPLSQGSPYSSRSKWLKHSEKTVARELTSRLKSDNTKAVYIAGRSGSHKDAMKNLAKEYGVKVRSSPIKVSGKKDVAFDYFITPDGKLVFNTNHPSSYWSNDKLDQVREKIQGLMQ